MKPLRDALVETSIRWPRAVAVTVLVLTILFAGAFPWVEVDTDPENMLAEDEFVRLFHDEVKREFSLYDMIVLGVVNEAHPDGVFNPETLRRVHDLTETIRGFEGVIAPDILAPSNVDNVEQAGPNTITFEWLMPEPPATREEALAIRDKARRLSFLDGTLISEDGMALGIYIPLASKDMSHRIARAIQAEVKGLPGDDQFHITGLPVAEDTFGYEMFIQMAVSAPLAMLVIFLLLLYFFRKPSLIVSPLLVAMATVIITMGLLIATGNTVHIMSSMIPIFLMPIAVVDSVHILSSFFDRYPETRDRKKTIRQVMSHLFMPMLYTSLTTMAGFGSLALTPIPPVQVFGIFVAFGVGLAWLLTVLFIPAYIMFLKEESLANFGVRTADGDPENRGLLARSLHRLGDFALARAKLVLVATVLLLVVAGYGISRIRINDNPVKWFTPGHPIRVADKVLNAHFGGTYEAYLVLGAEPTPESVQAHMDRAAQALDDLLADNGEFMDGLAEAVTAARAWLREPLPEGPASAALAGFAARAAERAAADADGIAWDEVAMVLDDAGAASQTFKSPEVLRYIDALQHYLKDHHIVGKSNSVADIVKTIYRELMGGDTEYERIPDTSRAVAQTLFQFESSHKPQDLYHLVRGDYERTNIWVQLRSGDNRDMENVVAVVDDYIARNAPPVPLRHDWAGLTYINVVWQDKMVSGMLTSLLGSFIIVLLMMTFLFRSPLWGLLAMVPLTVTIAATYGLIGLVGKDYDMPVAVLSSLTLGLAIDFAIHFLERSRAAVATAGSWRNAVPLIFGEPARAITRNGIVIAVGFLPLLAAPLVPYKTVGFFMAAIMALSGVATLIILPAIATVLTRQLFPKERKAPLCNCGICLTASIVAVLAIALGVRHYAMTSWTPAMWIAAVGVIAAILTCYWVSRRSSCNSTQDGPSTE